MSYSVQGIAYDTREEAMTALIGEWVSAGGDNPKSEAEKALDNTDTAGDLIKNWGGGLGDDYATEGDILEHMANYRAEILAHAYA